MRIAIYPGSFDPITNGHIDIIERASLMVEKLIVTVSINSSKTPLFTIEERVNILKEVLDKYPNVFVDTFDGLTVDYAKKQGAHAIIRGLRAISDFENEFKMALTNKNIVPEVETLFLMTKAEYSFLSSSVIKELAMFNGSVKDFVPKLVETKLKEKFIVK